MHGERRTPDGPMHKLYTKNLIEYSDSFLKQMVLLIDSARRIKLTEVDPALDAPARSIITNEG